MIEHKLTMYGRVCVCGKLISVAVCELDGTVGTVHNYTTCKCMPTPILQFSQASSDTFVTLSWPKPIQVP